MDQELKERVDKLKARIQTSRKEAVEKRPFLDQPTGQNLETKGMSNLQTLEVMRNDNNR